MKFTYFFFTLLFAFTLNLFAQNPLQSQEITQETAQALANSILNTQEREIANQAIELVMTTCNGCTGTLSTASPSCYPSNMDRQRIERMAATGMPLNEILAVFEEERGPQAVAIPTDSTTRNIAWILPIITLLVAASALVFWFRRKTKQKDDETEEEVEQTLNSEDQAYLDQLRDELKRDE